VTSRWRAPLALIVLAALFACLKGRTPTDASTGDVRFNLKAQVSGGSTLHVTVVYLDQNPTSETPTPVMLLDQRITVAAGTQNLPLTIDVTRCLADPLHITGTTCELLAGVVLEQNGQEVDSVGIGPISVSPGQTVHDSTSLVAVGQVVVFPKTASLTVGAITTIGDSVFSPTGVYLPGATVRWTSADTTVATVNQNGAVTGVAGGQTTVTASVGGASDFATITVSGTQTTGGITFPGLQQVGNTVTFSAVVGGPLPVAGFVPVASTDTVVVGDLVATITPASALQWLVANVSDSSFGSRVTHRPPGFHAQQIRKQSSGSGVTTPAFVDLHPTTTNLAAGTYNATVTVSGDGNRSAAFSVAYTVAAPAPTTLAFTPNPVFFDQYAYGSAVAPVQTVTAYNSGSGTLGALSSVGTITYTGADTGWITVTAASATTATGQPKTTSLHLGPDTASIPISAVGATNNPVTLTAIVTSYVTYSKVVLGAAFGCGLTTASTVYCWGGSGQSELGDGGSDLGVTTPVRANIPYSPTNPVIDIEAGSYHACALQQSGRAYCWGKNDKGQVGVNSAATVITTPTAVASQTFGAISLGAEHTCGIMGTPPLAGANYVYCWGDNTDGAFGNNLPTSSSQIVPLNTGNIEYAVSAGDGYTCFINNKVVGGVYCTGLNNAGQLGNGYSGSFYSTPQQAQVLNPSTGGLAVVTSISAGYQTTCAVDNAGNGSCWGDNSNGQIGDGQTSATPVVNPTLIPGGYSWTSISTGFSSVCGIASTGSFCWGYNNYGQLGVGDVENATDPSPQAVVGSGALFSQLIVGQGSQSACDIFGGAVACWGFDSNGQLGLGPSSVGSAVGSPTQMIDQPAPSGVTPSRNTHRPPVTLSPAAARNHAVSSGH
jgi:alpha-tubulin suppressor-like RCC1 family protein